MMIRVILLGLLLAPVAGWAFCKPLRVLVPDWNGVYCISKEVCVENLARLKEAVTIYEKALSFVNESVEKVDNIPRATFCSTAECFDLFGFQAPAKAMTIGVSGIVIGPEGWNEHFLRHEIIHHLQSERLGVVGQWLSPTWFKEGMAYSLSEEPRKLEEPWSKYRTEFESWHRHVGNERLWLEAKKL